MKYRGIDWKFIFEGHNPCTGKEVSHMNAMVFKASDACLPDLLKYYMKLLADSGASQEQIEGVKLLRRRVMLWQSRHKDKVKTPDVNRCEIDAGLTGPRGR